jgi:UDP-glucose 4-epimerase
VGEGVARKALVTGATGFIGRRLVDALRLQGVAVGVLARDTAKARALWSDNMVTIAEADLGVPETIGDACSAVQTLFHVAGHAHAEDEGSAAADALHERVTVTGTQALLDAAVGVGVQRVVFVSSVKAMGEGSSECLDERCKAEPASAYGRAKREAEQLVLEAGRRYGLHTSVLRLPLVYGPGVKGNLLRMMAAIDRGRFPPLPETGNKRSMVHVDDVVRGVLLATEHPQAAGQIYIVTDGQTYSTRRIYELLCKGLGKQALRWSIPQSLFRASARMGDLIEAVSGRRFVFDSTALEKLLGSAWYSSGKIARELGYRPTQTLDDSIKEMVAAYRAAVNRDS